MAVVQKEAVETMGLIVVDTINLAGVLFFIHWKQVRNRLVSSPTSQWKGGFTRLAVTISWQGTLQWIKKLALNIVKATLS
jgi:hypothetical protein